MEGGPGGLAKSGDARKPGEPAETRKPKTEGERPGTGGSGKGSFNYLSWQKTYVLLL